MTSVGRLAERLRELGEERLLAVVRTEAAGTALRGEAASKKLASARLAVRTGRLRNSIAGLVEDEPDAFLVKLRATVPYSKVQEEGSGYLPGGVVRPKNGRFLAIPADTTAAGVSRYASPRDVPDLKFVPTRGGAGGMLVRDIPGRGKSGRGARTEIVYWLVRSVTIKGKFFLRDGLDEGGKGLTERLQRRVKALLEAGEA